MATYDPNKRFDCPVNNCVDKLPVNFMVFTQHLSRYHAIPYLEARSKWMEIQEEKKIAEGQS
jgi:hypothetical protein